MNDIKQILQCHGLKIEARQNITLNNIIKKIDTEKIAILPMRMGNGLNHYFVITLNSKREVILVNVLRGVSLLNETQLEKNTRNYNKLFTDAGGVVLFVKKNKDRAVSISKAVKLNPDTIELGEFMIGGPESSSFINASFDLINTSDLPIMVSSIQTTCGCTKMDWDGGILKAGEKKEVKFSVIPGAWGRGEKKKIARVSFVDGSTIDVTIHGTGQTPAERQRIELSQYSAIIEINDETNTEFFDVRLARLSSYVRPIQEIKMTSDVSWLKPELIDQEKKENHETAELHARLSVQEIRSLLDSSDNKLQRTLHISGNKEMEPVEMKVEVFQRDFYRLSQYLVTVSKNISEYTMIQVYPEKENDNIKILDLKTETDFIIAKSEEVDGIQSISIKLDSEKTIKTGYYTVTAKIKNSKGSQNLARITINVSE
jgi:hypothetical protein